MSNISKDNIIQPATLQEAINVIKFLTISHKQEVARLREAQIKQAEVIKKLELNRKKELEFLSGELQKYEVNLALRTENVAKQLSEKDNIIKQQAETIEELTKKLQKYENFTVNVPEIVVDSNSDSGINFEAEDSGVKTNDRKTEVKTVRKCSRRFGDTISFLRRVDFSPMKYKPSKDATNKDNKKKHSLEVPVPGKRTLIRQFSQDKSYSEDERILYDEAVLSDSGIDLTVIKPNKINDSMNNHFSDDGSEDTSEEIFDRVMTRSSVRRSVKANPKYKKINRSKSKLLEQVKNNIID